MSNLVTIAHVYGPNQAGLIIAALEACNITVLCHNFHATTTLTHYTQALGGMQIAVPEAEAADADDILASLGTFNPTKIKEWVVPFLIFGVLFGATPPPASGVFPIRGTVHGELK